MIGLDDPFPPICPRRAILDLTVLGQALIQHDLRAGLLPDLAALATMFGGPMPADLATRSRPRSRAGANARTILERLAELSSPFGTALEITGETAHIAAG